MFIPDLDLDIFAIPDAGSRGQKSTGSRGGKKSTGSRIATLVTSMSNVADPDPGSGGLFDPWVRDPGWLKSQDPDPG